MAIKQITIIGTGLMGGSFALAAKKYGFAGRIVGCDRAAILDQAQRMGVVDAGFESPEAAVRGSQVVLLATPVGAIIDMVERLGPVLPPATLLTDVGSTKLDLVFRASDIFGADASRRFLAGHPMAGKEHSGIEHAEADLFQDAVWLVTPLPGQDVEAGLCGEFLDLVRRMGARIISMDPQRHDRVCAWLSHLPQMLSTAFAATLMDELGNDPDLEAIGGRALREMTRIAQSPYSMWRDIAFTNTANIEEALLRLEQRIAHLRDNLRTRELEAEFERARSFRKPPAPKDF
jgi:prephenate dehydrogenase